MYNELLCRNKRTGNDIQRYLHDCVVQIVIIAVQHTKVGLKLTEVGVIFHFYIVYVVRALESRASSKQVVRKWCACRTSLACSDMSWKNTFD